MPDKKRRRLYFDLETDGFLENVTVIHSLVIKDVDTGEVWSCRDVGDPQAELPSIQEGLWMLAAAAELIGHNIIKYDIPVIQKLYPGWKHDAKVTDTLIIARLLFPEIKDQDFRVRERQLARGMNPILPGNLIGSHSLEAWGYRLGKMKGDYSKIMKERGEDPWAKWNRLMQEYCEQDVEVTEALYLMCTAQPAFAESDRALWIEHRFAEVMFLQEQHGFRFNVSLGEKLEAAIRTRKAAVQDTLDGLFEPWWVGLGVHIPKRTATTFIESPLGGVIRTKKVPTGETYEHVQRNGKRVIRNAYREVEQRGYYETVTEGVPFQKVEYRVFNPGSRMQIADRLKTLYGWQPVEFTNNGEPKIDDDVLSELPYPPAKALAEFFMLEKRLGQLADGRQAWLKVHRNGRIHGRINTLGAVTGRCTHSDPNVAQVPSIENANGPVPYGAECRDLWVADEGHVLIGCDADGLELRCLAHFMQDAGRYSKIVDEGDKDKGTDIHTMNQKAAGLPTRSTAKTFIYAFLYGAGNEKIGSIVGGDSNAGARLKAKFLDGTPGLNGLINAVKAAAKRQGWIRGIDGRRVVVRHQHAALNTLLQNAGAVAMKLATVLFYDRMIAEGHRWGTDFALVANIHDEIQVTAKPEIAEIVKHNAVWAIEEAGRQLNFKCPLRGSAAAGKSWKDTH